MRYGVQAKGSTAPLILIVCLFFLWGIVNNLNDVLIPHFKKAFSLSDLQSGLVQSAFYLGYFLLALPAGLVMRRLGYKSAVVTGLLLLGCGTLLFYPAAELGRYGLFLAALFVIASGLAFLETSANPLITVLGEPASAERRLNFAQAFNPLGAITGVLLGREFILSGIEPTAAQLAQMSAQELSAFRIGEAQSVQGPYLFVASVAFLWMILVLMSRFPDAARRPPIAPLPLRAGATMRALLGHRRLVFGVAAQFFYVGAQVGIWSFMIRYAQHEISGLPEKTAASYLTWSLVGFMIGRFVGTALMGRIRPTKLMGLYALCGLALSVVAVLLGGTIGVLALAATSFFMSIMFPTIFANSIRGLGELTHPAASLLVMSIIGGAVLTALMGFISDQSSIRAAMLVPAACFGIVAAFGLLDTGRHAVTGRSSAAPAAIAP
ncbi:MAG: L-fucose:H+ symporter permease [Pseudomonadota bacterium]|nr:L-fucose:H+ symporter permease [Pseudomonadota bacterium]